MPEAAVKPARRSKTFSQFTGDLGDAKGSVKAVTEATRTGNMSETIRQVFFQLEREMKRKGIEEFAYSDITIEGH